MNKMYCYSCGVSISYAAKKPKFCQRCGESLGTTVKSNKWVVEKENLDTEKDEDDIYWSIDQFTQGGLEVDIDIHSSNETFGDMGKIEGYKSLPRGEVKLEKQSQEQNMEEFAREAGAKGARETKRPKGKGRGRPKKK